MKILAIRGNNLASLMGDFELILDKEPLGPTGLFAIRGPTGSGKSTLLDAMCLALYARTPRLNSKVNSSVNSLVGRVDEDPSLRLKSQDPRGLLSRGCGSGFAEVDFRGQDGRAYRARWTVRRARNKPQGRYQSEKISLIDIETEERLGEHKKDSLELIQQKLGLDYDQFRRSVLLAQGDFAAFLEADPSERGELLESITGMEIYSRLSRAAHERAKEEKVALEILQAESKGLAPLAEEERQGLEKQELTLSGQQALFEKDRQSLAKNKDWYEIHRKHAESETLARKELFARLRILREKANLPVTAWSALEGDLALAAPMLELSRDLHRALSGEVEELAKSEAELAEWKRSVQKAQAEWVGLEKEAVSSEKALVEAEKLRSELGKQGLENGAWFAAHEDWKELCTQWPRWKQELDRANEVASDLAESLREKVATEKSLVAYKQDLTEARAQHEAAGKQRELAEKDLTVIAKQLSDLDLDALLAELARVRGCREAIDDLLELSGRGQGLDTIRRKALAAGKEQGQLLQKARGERDKADQERLGLESARKESQRQLESLLERQSLEDHRKKLKPGEPCPLCGALEHPSATELVQELLDEASARTAELGGQADQVQAKLQRLSSQIGSQETAQKEALSRADSADKERLEIEAEALVVISELEAVWRDESLPLLAKDDIEMELLRGMRGALQDLERVQNERIEERGVLEKKHRRVTGQRDQALELSSKTLEAQRELESDLQKAELGIKYAADGAERTKKELAKLLDGLDSPLRSKQGWRDLFYGEERDQLLEELDQLCLDWEERDRKKESISKQLADLDSGRQGLLSQSQERRKRADALNLDRRAMEAAIAERETLNLARLGGQGSAVLRDLLVDADKQAVLVKERSGLLRKHGELRPSQSEEESRKAVEENAMALKELGAETESLRHRLRVDNETRAKLAVMLPDIEAQQGRSEIWHELASLIGSYDGRKFRDFAQSLSLDAMIAQANHHLTELAPRYRLQRVPGQDLDLQIMDLYMGDEVRSVHSLSGGESFLVSLALALGLSSMHASYCSLESLFIDEGFGSLDEESLEIAVAALDALQATGRQIGLISHVAGMAERIGREVEVHPLGGGRSQLRY